MRTFYLLGFFFILWFHSFGQGEIIDLCFVVVLENNEISDLRKASFGLPFYAKRAVEGAKPEKIKHIMFNPAKTSSQGKNGLVVSSVRPYEFGEELKSNELAFFVMSWPETEPNVASFPTPNDLAVSTDHFIVNEDIALPEKLVHNLNLNYSTLKKGTYSLKAVEFEY